MSDNLRRVRAIRAALTRAYPIEPKGNLARHLNVLAEMISGIVGSKRSNLSEIADNIADRKAKPESRVKSRLGGIGGQRVTKIPSTW
jgi:hypothetical protein